MGSSSKKKKEKKKDFQKPKLKVGKAKPKADNQTDTSFRAKAIVLNQQSLNVAAPSTTHQFEHYTLMLSSRSDSQRKESLSYLTTFVASSPANVTLPMPVGNFLDKACPLILDGSSPVRQQVSKLLQSLRITDLRDHVARLLPYIRAGMTHLSKDIRITSIDLLSWLLGSVGDEIVCCPGGWQKTLQSFVTLLGWRSTDGDSKWSAGKASFGNESKTIARVMQVLDHLIRTGTEQGKEDFTENTFASDFPVWQASRNRIAQTTNPYQSLGLFGTTQTDGNQILEDYEDRIRVFNDHFRSHIQFGVLQGRSEGGELGRAAGLLAKTLKQSEV